MQLYVLALKMPTGRKTPTQTKNNSNSGGFRVEKHDGDVIFFDKENNFK